MASVFLRNLKRYVERAFENQLTENSPRAEQPAWIKTPLRPHQLALLAAAKQLETRRSIDPNQLNVDQLVTSYGIIADKVGTGKSLVALSLVSEPMPQARSIDAVYQSTEGCAHLVRSTLTPPINEFSPDMMNLSMGDLKAVMFPHADSVWRTRTSLIIVPYNIIGQWEQYIAAHTTLDAIIIKRADHCTLYTIQQILTANVVICSSTMLRPFYHYLYSTLNQHDRAIIWSRVFIDEADSIVLPNSTTAIEAQFYWMISGSYANMMFPTGINQLRECNLSPMCLAYIGDRIAGIRSKKSLVGAVLTPIFKPPFADIILRNNEEWVGRSLLSPTITHINIHCRAPKHLALVKGLIPPEAMTALHAGDVAGAITILGLNTGDKASIVDKLTTSIRIQLDTAEKTLAFKESLIYETPAAREEALKKAQEKVDRVRDQLNGLLGRIEGMDTTECPICFNETQNSSLTPCCKNAFCLTCICDWLAQSAKCPVCRASIRSVNELTVLGTGTAVAAEENSLPNKAEALITILNASTENQRILVFSEHDGSFANIQQLLNSKGVTSAMLKGNNAHIAKTQREFEAGKIRVLFMNAREVGAGLNLGSTTDVVLYHKMSNDLERQIVGRAIRFERTAPLTVHHIMHEGEN